MKKWSILLMGLLAGCGSDSEGTSPVLTDKYDEQSGKVVASYYTSWSVYNDFTPAVVRGNDLTHLVYAFAAPCGAPKPEDEMNESDKMLASVCQGKATGTAVIHDLNAFLGSKGWYEGDLKQLQAIKTHSPNLKIILSFGGYSLSGPFSDLIKTDSDRQHFVQSSIDLITRYPVFDGIDIDWEFPGGGGMTNPHWDPDKALTDEEKQVEKEGFTIMMRELRQALEQLGQTTNRDYELSAAIPPSPHFTKGADYGAASAFVDHYYVMTYEFFNAGLKDVGFASNLHAHDYGSYAQNVGIDAFINNLISLGVPANKMVLGVPFNGNGWSGVKADQDQPILGENAATGQLLDAVLYSSNPNYADLLKHYINKNGFIDHYDQQAGQAYLYNPNTEEFISYDNPRSIKAKGDYLRSHGLAGMFSWEIVDDDSNGTLLDAMNEAVGNQPLPNE